MHKSIVLIGLFVISTFLFSQNKNEKITTGFYDSIDSEILDAKRSLQIFLPENYESSGKAYPVIYHLYGDRINQYWLEAVSTVYNLSSDGAMPEFILVGIDEVDRYRFLIPRDGDGNATNINLFTEFIRDELIPYIDNNYRTMDYRILVGPQVGANFGLYTLFTNPDLFDAFIITHPFRWSGGRDYLEGLSKEYFNDYTSGNKFLFITSDDDDEYTMEGHPALERLEKLITEVKPKGFRFFRNHLGTTGDFVSTTGLKAGLKTLFDGYNLPSNLEVTNLSDIEEYYTAYFEKLGSLFPIPELGVVMRADALQEKDLFSAMEILEYLKVKYPKSPNAFWRLAQIYEKQNDYHRALEHYEKCVENAPGFIAALNKVKELGEKVSN